MPIYRLARRCASSRRRARAVSFRTFRRAPPNISHARAVVLRRILSSQTPPQSMPIATRPIFALLAVACAAAPLSAQASGDQKRSTKAVVTERPVWPDEGPAKWAPRPTNPEITANDLRTRLYQFADDSMAGRRIGEPGNYKGTEYIAREFKRLGLKPAGDSGTYFQVLPFGPQGFELTASNLIAGGK